MWYVSYENDSKCVSGLWNGKKGKLEPLLNVQNKLSMCDKAEQNKRHSEHHVLKRHIKCILLFYE